MGKPVKARTVEGAIRAIGQTIASMGTMSFGVGVDSIAGSKPSVHITLSSVNKMLNSPGSKTTSERFELSRSKSNGLAIHRLNHSATMSCFPEGNLIYIYPYCTGFGIFNLSIFIWEGGDGTEKVKLCKTVYIPPMFVSGLLEHEMTPR